MMSTAAFDSLHHFAQQGKTHLALLLEDLDDPHAEMLALLWGPRFDREHAIGLWADWSRREPVKAVPVLPVLMNLADRFDALTAPMQHRLRRLILRHQALQTLVV